MAKKPKYQCSLSEIERMIDTSVEEDYPNRTRYRKRGRRSKLGVCGFLYSLYVLNEHLSMRNHQNPMTNATIEREFRKEFSHMPEVTASWDKGYSSVNSFRHKFNKGVLLESAPYPDYVSLRYDTHGNPVDARTGRHKLLPEECRELCIKYCIADSRFCDEATIKAINESKKTRVVRRYGEAV